MPNTMVRLAVMFSLAAFVSAAASIGVAADDQKFGFNIDLGLTVEALQTLERHNEQVIFAANYYADPSDAGMAHADEMGRLDLGTEMVEVKPEPGIVRILGDQLDQDSLRWIEGEIGVNVNIYTARLSSEDNLIDCDFIDGPLANVVDEQPVSIRCGLITEQLQTKIRP